MTDEIGSEGSATLDSGDLSNFDANVKVMTDDDAVSGTATFLDEQLTPYTANAATTGVAGVY